MYMFLIERNDEDLNYDEVDSHVIAAANGDECRKIASENCGYEGPEPWLDPNKSRCSLIKLAGPGVILSSGTGS